MSLTDGSISSQLEWLGKLEIPPRPKEGLNAHYLRKTSIIATIGPKSNKVDVLQSLLDAGMNVVRMNFSHGSYEYHQSVIDNARAAAESSQRPVAIALDTKGPEIRTGKMVNGEDIPIKAGHQMIFSTDPQYKDKCDDKVMFIDYANMAKMLEPGKLIYVDDGILSFTTKRIEGTNIHVEAFNNGVLSSYKGVNLPGTDVDLPALSDKDKADLDFGVKNNVDMIFASFIRRGEDVKNIRTHLGEKGAHIKIISKIENLQGCANFDEILKETDGVMVARGDLGIEIPASQVFMAQKMMIAKCQLAGKPSICATQMLESMTNNPRPTRAEVSDVANAVLDGADCVMLSGETAKGAYPVHAVKMMAETCYLAESSICYPPLFNELRALTTRPTDTTETVAMAAVAASHEQGAGAIIVMSHSGNTARLIAKYRPECPIILLTRNASTSRQAHLHRGVYPILYANEKPGSDGQWQKDVDARLNYGMEIGIELGILTQNSTVIAVQGWRSGGKHTNTLRVLTTDILSQSR